MNREEILMGHPYLRRLGITGVILAVVIPTTGVSASAATPANSLGSPQVANSAALNAQIEAFQESHSNDVGAIDKYVYKLTGQHVEVSSNRFSGTRTGTEAQKYNDAAKTAQARRPMGGIPSYTVQVYTVPLLGPPHQVRVVGNWDFPDAWIGVGAPVDLASLSWTNVPSCMEYFNYNSSTYKYDNSSTNRGYLQTANTAAHAPIWAIQDAVSGFVNYTDHGYVSVDFWDNCAHQPNSNMEAEFNYDANQGQNNVSASAGWGFLTVNFGGSGQNRKEGTAPIYFHD